MVSFTVLNGLVGGLVATIVMTVFMMTLGDDSPPPPALFWSKYVGDGGPDEYMMQGVVLHMLYGTVAGVVFALGVPALGLGVTSLTLAVAAGVVWGFVLFVVAAVFWMKVVLDLDAEPPMVAMFLFFHLVYGAVLGAWIGVGVL